MVTPGTFSSDALKSADLQKDRTIILIDGEKLALFMFDFGIGVRTKKRHTKSKKSTKIILGKTEIRSIHCTNTPFEDFVLSALKSL